MTTGAERIRDADRSRAAILDAAEAVFADRGFASTSLSDIGAAAGLSRGTPSYFFGSKERLYRAVLERVFAERQEATARAFAPVHAWCEGSGDLAALRRALAKATTGYMTFLGDRPAFVRLVMWEELHGGGRLRATPRASTAMVDAFTALRGAGRRRGLRAFDAGDAVLLYVALTFSPLAFDATLLSALDRRLADATRRRRHTALVVDQVMRLIAAR